MPAWSDGPFHSYISGYAPVEIRKTLDDVDAFILENGPFDGVFGFSQGAAIAITYILDYQRRLPDCQPPFRFAVFFSPVVSFFPDPEYCRQVVQTLLETCSDDFKNDFPIVDCSTLVPPRQTFAGYLSKSLLSLEQVGFGRQGIDDRFLVEGDEESVPRPVHPHLLEDRIHIPTVHVNGKKDHMLFTHQAQVALGLCCDNLVRVHKHFGGHGIPTKKADVRAIISSIEWAMEQSIHMEALARLSHI